MAWPEAEVNRLKALAKTEMFNVEIAKEMGRPVASVSWKLRKLGITRNNRHRYGLWNIVHKDLRRPVFEYFLEHSFEETRDHFKLTNSQLKSIFTVGYRKAELKHLRKDNRTKRPMSAQDYKILLTHAGLVPRKWIGLKLGRGKETVIKERLQRLGLSSRTLQGITLSQYRTAFLKDPSFVIETKAGPSRERIKAPTLWKIIPWVTLRAELRSGNIKAPKIFKQMVETMAMFQEWIFEGHVIMKMQKIVSMRRPRGCA